MNVKFNDGELVCIASDLMAELELNAARYCAIRGMALADGETQERVGAAVEAVEQTFLDGDAPITIEKFDAVADAIRGAL